MILGPKRFFVPCLLLPGSCLACACGCGIFDVGTNSMYANHAGGMVFAEFDYLDQSHNRSGTSTAPAANNDDKEIRTSFWTLGGQYQFNRLWGLTIEVPYWQRYFQTTSEGTGAIVSSSHGAAGDIRIKASYTGFSADMSTGITLGVKLANGDTGFAGFDADTQIGSGSTDALVGAYHLGRLSGDQHWSYFLQGQWDQPLVHKANYRPGAEGVVVFGMYYEGWSTHQELKFVPIMQLRAVHRRPDGGADAMADDSGYSRLLASPGLEVVRGKLSVYADVALPLYTNARGNQLFANEMWKLNVNYHF
jgi:hypothetical protein